MDIPRGHAMLPLNEADFLDFIYNYYKAEYSPIRSFWSTATAEPRQSHRWISMGHELSPLSFRAANAQAQKDLESLDYFCRRWNLDSSFVRGIVIRYAKHEVHERLEKKLYECARCDLMVRKALKEKHLIDALWPSPAPRNIAQELLQQGVQVRKWYGDMFAKYFKHLHAVDDFSLRPEVDLRIKNSGTLMLVPFVDHLVFGTVEPIMPIVAKGAGYSNAKAWKPKDSRTASVGTYGEPDRFEIRFDAPKEIEDTYTRGVTRQCQCKKCGSRRDVQVVVSIDPNPSAMPTTPSGQGDTSRRPNDLGASASRRHSSKAAQRYSPGYRMPGVDDTAPLQPPRPHGPPPEPEDTRPQSPQQKKQCPRCTFLNHPDLTSCEMCQSELPATTVAQPPSPELTSKTTSTSSHSHSASLPPPTTADMRQKKKGDAQRPEPPNRHSLSSTLFSIFPFSQQQQSEHHANLPPTQPTGPSVTAPAEPPVETKREERPASRDKSKTNMHQSEAREAVPIAESSSAPPNLIDVELERPSTPPLSQPPEMAMMPMTPPPVSDHQSRAIPAGMPQNLMDDFVPVSPSYQHDDEEDDAGWGEMSREEANRQESDEDDEDGEVVGRREGMIDLDVVAQEEMGVWGERED